VYGRYGTIIATPGNRDALLAILVEAASASDTMPGCRSYIVGAVLDDPNAIAVIEVWDEKASHEASLKLETVRETIGRARPLIAGFGASSEFRPAGGVSGVAR
jgi:quinol monooxygenase YgiN